jgi:hypothetical protein
MSKKVQFVLLMQTALIVDAVVDALSGKGEARAGSVSRGVTAATDLATALEVTESQLPPDLMDACAKTIQYLRTGTSRKPNWLLETGA